MHELYVGVMSGTSLDGIDAVLASFGPDRRVNILNWLFEPYPQEIYPDLRDLLEDPRSDSPIACRVDEMLGNLYAQAVVRLLEQCPKEQVRAIGIHGQTIIHRPDADPPFTWQVGNSKVVARTTGIPVVYDLRRADMVAGGQGAPLAPAFHAHAFQSSSEARAVVNIGGISNVTYLPSDSSQDIVGFDTGPGNALSDQWIRKHRGLEYDAEGKWAMSARADACLLDQLMKDPYFRKPAPKSLDSRTFSLNWLENQVQRCGSELDAAVIQRTVAAFTARSIWWGIDLWMPQVKKIYLCGGGAHNHAIVADLRGESGLEVVSTEELGILPDQVEAVVFAWLAQRRMTNQTANVPAVTGASKAVVLGSLVNPV